MKFTGVAVLAAVAMLAMAGCGQKAEESAAVTASAAGEGAAPAGSGAELEKIVVQAPAPQAVGVIAAKQEVKDGDTVAVEGRVKDFVEGAAVFTITDGSLPSCKDNGEDCPTPWDFCCFAPKEIAEKSATVKLVGADGQPLTANVKGTNSIDHLTTVVAEGKAKKDEQGNLVVEASKVYVKK